MSIIHQTDLDVQVEPTELDRQYAAETSPFADLDVQDDDEPIEEYYDSTDHGDDERPWWETLPECEDLDARWCLTIAGGAGSLPANEAWAAEGRARLRACGSTRGDLYGRDTAGDGRD